MAMAAGAALLRSVVTKMARPSPRLAYALEHHGRLPTSSGGPCLSSRFSTSTGGSSMPPSANLRGPQPHNKEVPSGRQSYRFIVGFCEALPYGVAFLLGCHFYARFSVNPRLDRIEADMDAECEEWETTSEEIKKSHERTRAKLLSNKGRQAKAAGFSEGQGMEDL